MRSKGLRGGQQGCWPSPQARTEASPTCDLQGRGHADDFRGHQSRHQRRKPATTLDPHHAWCQTCLQAGLALASPPGSQARARSPACAGIPKASVPPKARAPSPSTTTGGGVTSPPRPIPLLPRNPARKRAGFFLHLTKITVYNSLYHTTAATYEQPKNRRHSSTYALRRIHTDFASIGRVPVESTARFW